MLEAKRLAPIRNNTKNKVIEGLSTIHLKDFLIESISTIFPLKFSFI